MQGDGMSGSARSTLGTAQAILKQQGVRGLWRGTGPTVWRLGLGVGLHMVRRRLFAIMGKSMSAINLLCYILISGLDREH